MKVSDYIIDYLAQKGIKYVFGYIGGAITHLVDSAYKDERIQFIQVYHEQTASIAAEGFSRNSSQIGVAMSTSGPGATNMVTGIADAFFDSIPTIFITGQVNTYEYKYDKNVRQQGFQETDIVSMVKPITKYAKLIDSPSEIKFELDKAFYLTKEGRPGPVLLDIPMDVQRAEVAIPSLISYQADQDKENAFADELESIVSDLKNSKRPIILAGGGVINSGAEQVLLDFAEKHSIPVVCSLMGKGAFPEDHKQFVGMIGSYGNRCANMALANSDFLIALGTRLDTRQTGTQLDSFLREGKIVHVDIDSEEVEGNRLYRDYKIVQDAKAFLESIEQKCENFYSSSDWLEYISQVKENFSQKVEVEKNVENKLPYTIMDVLNSVADEQQIYCVDIGQNQIFSAQMLKIKEKQKFYTSGGLAPMGYAIPVAVGASFACEHSRNIFAITGDGGFHIATQSLMLLSQYKLPIKVIVLNNQALGMITQFQDLYFDEKKVATTPEAGYLVPSIELIAKSYSLEYHCISEQALKERSFSNDIFLSKEPTVIEVMIGNKTKMSPKLEVNSPIEDTGPKMPRKELQENMLIDLFQPKS